MFSVILNWIGAVGGILILLAMAFGRFALDLGDALDDHRRRRSAKAAETGTTAQVSRAC